MTHTEYAIEYRYEHSPVWRRTGRFATKAETEQRIAMLDNGKGKVEYRVVKREVVDAGWSQA